MKRHLKIFLYLLLGTCVGILLLLFVCNNLICSNTEGRLYTDVTSTPQYEVGLLLGTAPQTRINRRPNQFFAYRIDAAETLYKAGKVKSILISGDENSLDGINEVECMRDSLVARGIPDTAILLDGKGFRTLDAVVRATKVYDKHNYIVISQKFHNERAIYLAEHSGLDVANLSGFNAAEVTSYTSIMTYVREYFARVKVFIDILTDKEQVVSQGAAAYQEQSVLSAREMGEFSIPHIPATIRYCTKMSFAHCVQNGTRGICGTNGTKATLKNVIHYH